MPLKAQLLPGEPTSISEAVNRLRRELRELKASRATLAAWTALPYAAGWSDYGSGYLGGRYHKLTNGTVELEGLTTYSSTPIAGTVLATLPTGFRPTADILVGRLPCGTASTATLDLYIRSATGNVECQNVGAGTFQWLPLTGIHFSTT